MAINDNVAVSAGEWTQLTNANALSVRVANNSIYSADLQATAGTTAPTSRDGAITIGPGQVLPGDLALADMWAGVAGGDRSSLHPSQLHNLVRPV